MNKYCNLSKDELLEICKIIHSDTEWTELSRTPYDAVFEGVDNSFLVFRFEPIDGEDEIEFFLLGHENGEIYNIGKEMLEESEDKINMYLNIPVEKNQKGENRYPTGKDYNFKEDEIKSLFIYEEVTDKFTKAEKYVLKPIDLDKNIFDKLADSEAGISSINRKMENISASLKRSKFYLDLRLIYSKKSEQDLFALKITLTQMNAAGDLFKVNALKDGKITFLFDDNKTIYVSKEINYDGDIGDVIYIQEELLLETDISLLTKIINSKTIEYRVEGARGVISESKLTTGDIMNFVGFYNVLFDNTFKKDEIISFLVEEKKKEEEEKEKKKEERKKIIEEQIEKQAEQDALKGENPNPCFVVTATMKDPNHPIVNDYRLYRDRYLLNNKVGFNFVKIYYRVAPYFARLINNSETLRKISFNTFIKPLHKLIQKKIDTNNN